MFCCKINAWRGCIQFLCTHCYNPIRIRKIEEVVRVNFPQRVLGLKEAPLLFGIVKLNIPLAVNELIGSCYFA